MRDGYSRANFHRWIVGRSKTDCFAIRYYLFNLPDDRAMTAIVQDVLCRPSKELIAKRYTDNRVGCSHWFGSKVRDHKCRRYGQKRQTASARCTLARMRQGTHRTVHRTQGFKHGDPPPLYLSVLCNEKFRKTLPRQAVLDLEASPLSRSPSFNCTSRKRSVPGPFFTEGGKGSFPQSEKYWRREKFRSLPASLFAQVRGRQRCP